jgi:hypothetical protein
MTSADHSPETYRRLFGVIGAALQATALFFILASLLVAPWWVVVGLGVVWIVTAVWSWRDFSSRTWAPLASGTLVAVLWIAALTVLA